MTDPTPTDATEIRPQRWVTGGNWPPTGVVIASTATNISPGAPRPPAPANRAVVTPSPLTSAGTHLQYMPGTALVPAEPVHLPQVRQPRTTRRPRSTSHRAVTKAHWWDKPVVMYGLGFVTGAVALFAFFLLMTVISS